MSVNQISIHLDVAAQNAAGTVFSNPLKKVAVLRWEKHVDESLVLELAELALVEMESLGTNTLIYDMRRLPANEGQTLDVQARRHCLESEIVHRWGWLSSQEGDLVERPEVQALIDELGIRANGACEFHILTELLDSAEEVPENRLLTLPAPKDFYGTYAGSIYSLPEITTTVIRTAGNVADLVLAKQLFLDGIELTRRNGDNSLIIDTSATPPITDLSRYGYAYNSVILPLATSGLYKQVIHVRAGDGLVAEAGPPIAPLMTSLGVPLYDVSLMSEAISLTKVLQGKIVEVTEAKKLV